MFTSVKKEIYMNKYIGIDIGGTKCAVVLALEDGTIIEKERFDTADCGSTLERIFAAIEEMGGGYCAIGVSCGGPLDSRLGIIQSPPNLKGWDDVRITEMLTSRFGVPAYLQNDANACALAEWKYGAGVGTSNMVFLTFGTGMGAGLILDGRLYEGANGNAGEVGHLRLDRSGPVGYGKQGSFEGFCSGGGIAQIGRTLAEVAQQKGIAHGLSLPISAKSLAEDARLGNETALEVWRVCGEYLGRGLAVIIDLLNPECIVIGSIFQRSAHLLVEQMDRWIGEEALGQSRVVCRIVPAKLADEIGDVAAVSIAVDGFCRRG